MAEYPIIMKQKNNQGDYDTLYPKTLGSQVEGMTLDQVSGNLASSRINGDIPSSQITGTFPASQISYDNNQTSSIISSNQVQGAIDELFTSVSDGKTQIASAITDKGVSTSTSDSFSQMATNIGLIKSAQSFEGNGIINSRISDLRDTPFIITYSDINLTFIPDILFIKISPTFSATTGIILNIILNYEDNFYYSYNTDFYSNNLKVIKTDTQISFQIITNYAGREIPMGTYNIKAYKI